AYEQRPRAPQDLARRLYGALLKHNEDPKGYEPGILEAGRVCIPLRTESSAPQLGIALSPNNRATTIRERPMGLLRSPAHETSRLVAVDHTCRASRFIPFARRERGGSPRGGC